MYNLAIDSEHMQNNNKLNEKERVISFKDKK